MAGFDNAMVTAALQETAAESWECINTVEAVAYVCLFVRLHHRLAMDFWRSRWVADSCATVTKDGWFYHCPCYLSMWEYFWRDKREVASLCWQMDHFPACALTCVAVVLLMLKQAGLWVAASALFDVSADVGIARLAQWQSVYQTPWFVKLTTEAVVDKYVPNGSGFLLKEPSSPYSLDSSLPKENGFFDVFGSAVLRPLAVLLRAAWPTIRAEFAQATAAAPWRAGAVRTKGGWPWSRFVPGVITLGSKDTWWDQGRAAWGLVGTGSGVAFRATTTPGGATRAVHR
mmetsp:Transcript_27865/g.78488  ORF Transcript_27865/g.78488 Transcript_27865/m.78488 type:complete len:287 (+) Transcript_27865:77-937(+)